MTRTSTIARPLCALVAALVAAPLAAQEPTVVTGEREPVYQERVSLGDLDLTKWSHRNTLKNRVYRASERVCIAAEGPFGASLNGLGGTPSCTELTYEEARPQILAAIDRARTGRQAAMTLVVSAARASR